MQECYKATCPELVSSFSISAAGGVLELFPECSRSDFNGLAGVPCLETLGEAAADDWGEDFLPVTCLLLENVGMPEVFCAGWLGVLASGMT